MVKKILFFSILLLITIIPNIDVKAISFSRNGIGCVYFWDGHQYCDTVQAFSYNNINYYGANFSYTPDNNPTISATIVEFYNQSFCSNNSSGGVLNFRFYHNYPFENSVFNFIQLGVNNIDYTCTTSLSLDGRYSDVSCPIPQGFSNKTVGFKYRFNDLGFSFPFTSGFSNSVVTETCGISGGDIINSQNQNTQDIINNQNSNTNTIIQNQDDNTQDIIDNQNDNTQDIIDNQNANTDKEIESQKVCSTFNLNKDSIVLPNSYLSNNGSVLASSTGNGLTDYYEISSSTAISILPPIPESPQNACFYTSSKTIISCFRQSSIPQIPQDAKYIRFTLNSSNVEPRFSLFSCISGNQALNDSVNSLNDTLNSDIPPDTENEISDLESDLISDTPITDLITLPISLLNAYINGFNGSCSPYNLGNLYGTDLILPCLNLQQRLGSNLWTIIDSLFSIFMIYNIAMLMVQAFEGFTSLRDDYEGLYQPKHADIGYQPKHGGDN